MRCKRDKKRTRTANSFMDVLKKTLFAHPAFQILESAYAEKKKVRLQRVAGSFRALVSAYLTEKLRKPLLYCAADLDSAERLYDDLRLLCPQQNVVFLPGVEFEPYDTNPPSPSQLSLRMEATRVFVEEDQWIAVATPEGLTSHFPMPESFLDHQLFLKVGGKTDFETLVTQLHEAGLKREDMVEKVGDFSVRGGIIDLFVWNYEDPLRIEFFGNEIESIRTFDVFTQRSTGAVNEITILPNLSRTATRPVFLNAFLPSDTILFAEDTQVAVQKTEQRFAKAQQVFTQLQAEQVEERAPETLYMNGNQLEDLFSRFLFCSTNLIEDSACETIDFKILPHPDFNGSMKRFLQYVQNEGAQNGVRLEIQAMNQPQADRLREIIEEEEIPFNGRVVPQTLHNGFVVVDPAVQVLTDHEIFNRFKRRKTYRRFKNGEYLRQLSTLNLYDYVVHIDYGIGRYMGMEMLDLGPVKKECIKIAYRDGDHLFVTVDNLSRVQKFSSEEGAAPQLTKLGTPEWERAKQKTKESLKKVAAELIRLYAARKAQNGFSFSKDQHWQKELEASFMYEETEDQLKSINEVKQDMESEKPMDRLLCGDVGFGKTEVALRAAFKSVLDGKQVAVLVPTTILAFQHYETFRKRLAEFPVKVEMLNRFRTAKQQREILEGLAKGNIDIVIGTHRLISADVKFKDLGLLVVDEEQRFGVKQKEKLKQYRLSVDILSMTATPIPRTLHMALMGARDLSHIDTPPGNRLPVHTEIINWDDDRLYHIITREISRGGQVYFVHNRVETIQAIKENLSALVPQAKIAVGHGQLPEKRLEQVMLDFMDQKYDVLVATMIIENGLDIPNVNTIIINRADKFGLSQLYQLRGRVGRSSEQAYAYLLVPGMEKLTDTSRKRLRAIQDFTELGSGYKVALRDLEIRGAGNLLGKEQSGFVQTVGFDLYCKILDQAVEELKEGLVPDVEQVTGTAAKPKVDPKLDVDFDLFIPESFIPGEMERISVYHRLVNFSAGEQIAELQEELQDRFGKLPQSVRYFLIAIEIKLLAARIYAKRIILKAEKMKLFFAEEAQKDETFFTDIIPTLMNQKYTVVRFIDQKDLAVEIKLIGKERRDQLEFAKIFLHRLLENK